MAAATGSSHRDASRHLLTQLHAVSGGKADSAHTRGLAVDILLPASPLRYKFLKEALVFFKRIGLSAEFVHVDVDRSLPQGVLWLYGGKE